jgi:hypothetical protein
MDLYHFGKLDPDLDPHQSEKIGLDPKYDEMIRNKSHKKDPDPHRSQNQ